MTEGELLIRIKTALESGGLDAAKSKLGELITQTRESAAAGAKQQQQLDGVNSKFMQASQSVKVLSDLTKGSADSMFAAASGAQALFASMGNFAVVGGVVGAITAIVGIVMQFSKAAKDAEVATLDYRAQIKELNAIKLDEARKEIDALAKLTERAANASRDLHNANRDLQDAYLEKQIAEIEQTMPAGRERDDAIAAARRQAEIDKQAADKAELQRTMARDEQTRQDLRARRQTLIDEDKVAQERAASIPKGDAERTIAETRASFTKARREAIVPELTAQIDELTRQLENRAMEMRRIDVLGEAGATRYQAQRQDVAAARAKEDAEAKARADEAQRKETERLMAQASRRDNTFETGALNKRKKEVEEQLKGFEKSGLVQDAAREASEAATARRAVDVYDATGRTPDGRRVSRYGSAGSSVRRGLVDEADVQQQQADEALHKAQAARMGLERTLASISAELDAIKGTIHNSNT